MSQQNTQADGRVSAEALNGGNIGVYGALQEGRLVALRPRWGKGEEQEIRTDYVETCRTLTLSDTECSLEGFKKRSDLSWLPFYDSKIYMVAMWRTEGKCAEVEARIAVWNIWQRSKWASLVAQISVVLVKVMISGLILNI